MRFDTGMLRRAAVVAGLIAVTLPSIAEAATGEHHVLGRGERLLTLLGAGGATDPIANATRRAERQIGLKAHEAAALPSLLDRLVGRQQFVDPLRDNDPVRAHKPVPITRWAPPEFQDVGGTAEAIRPFAVLAAVDHAARPLLPGERPRLTDAPRLPWASAPMLPPLLTQPGESNTPVEIKRIVDPLAPPVPRRERQLAPQAGTSQPLLPFVSPVRSRSVPAKVAVSARMEPPRQSLPGVASLPSLDPFGVSPRGEPSGPAPAFIMPFENGLVSSLYNQGRRHPAIDLAGKMGAPVFATSNGQRVVFAGGRGGYGNAVITRDADGREHLYGHLSAINTRVGITLAQGDRLGALGSTGYSTGPHVHYEVKDRKGAHINPVTLLFPGRGVATGYRWAGTGLQRTPSAGATAEVILR